MPIKLFIFGLLMLVFGAVLGTFLAALVAWVENPGQRKGGHRA